MGAYTFHYERHRAGDKAFGHLYRRNCHIFKAIGLSAVFAIEMQVSMRMVLLPFFKTKLIMNDSPTVFKSMHYIVLYKQRQHAKNT